MEDFDEETREKRKREQIEYRNKKRTSTIFMVIASIFEILETLALMIVMFVILAFVMLKLLNPESQVVMVLFQIMSVVIFAGGMILGFLIYKKAVRWAIKKFNLEDALLDDVKRHYIKPAEKETEQELRR